MPPSKLMTVGTVPLEIRLQAFRGRTAVWRLPVVEPRASVVVHWAAEKATM